MKMGSAVTIRLKRQHLIKNSTKMKRAPTFAIHFDRSVRNAYRLLSVWASPRQSSQKMVMVQNGLQCDEFSEVNVANVQLPR